MKLRTRLFLSSSALLTVALIGLLLGMFGVLQLTQQQTQAMGRNLAMAEAGLSMRQELGNQVIALLGEVFDQAELDRASRGFRAALQQAKANASAAGQADALIAVEQAYEHFAQVIDEPMQLRRELMNNDRFNAAEERLRGHLNRLQERYVAAVSDTERETRQRAWTLASLLGIIGLAVLVIGYISAHSLAQRLARPIEALAAATDRIAAGDFHVALPASPLSELATLSQRFGTMARALGRLRATNVEELMDERRQLQAVLDSINDGLLILDATGKLRHANPIALRQLGWQRLPSEQTLGHALGHPELDIPLQQILDGDALRHAPDDLVIHSNGQTRLLACCLTPIQHSALCTGAVMVLHDVTEQRAFERVRHEFVLRASHELRTPVTGMRMAFGLLKERLHPAADSREAELVSIVDDEMQRLLLLINNLLNFSRYQSGVQPLELSTCDVLSLLQQARQRFATQAQEQQVSLMIDVPHAPPAIQADALQLERVLDNLISNALRHSLPGGRVKLQARQHGKRVTIGVEDNGEGIDYGQQTRIFQPFVQVGKRKGGAGLGLALCREIVQLHGGRIDVQSSPGRGSRFYVTLPL